MENVDNLLSQAENLVWQEIEKQVKKILLSPKNRADSFCSAMGTYFFSDDGEPLDEKEYMRPVLDLFEKYNDTFRLYGIGWRWDLVNGEVIKLTDF